MTARLRLAALIVWTLLAALAAAAMLVLPARPVVVGGIDGSPFEMGPLFQGWSLRQDIRPTRARELFVGFHARPNADASAPPTLELRLERGGEARWAARVRLERAGMSEYAAAFPAATDGAPYTLTVRVIEAHGGGVLVRGVHVRGPPTGERLTIMDRAMPDVLALGHELLQPAAPVLQLRAIAASLDGPAAAAAAGLGALALAPGAVAAVMLAHAYGRGAAAAASAAAAAALAVWLLLLAARLSAPPGLEGLADAAWALRLTSVGLALGAPVLLLAGCAAVVLALPAPVTDVQHTAGAGGGALQRAAANVGRSVRYAAPVIGGTIWSAATARRWRLAPIPLMAAAAAAAFALDAGGLAAVLSTAAMGAALVGAAAPRPRDRQAPDAKR